MAISTSYFTSVSGVLKCIQMVLSIVGIIFVVVYPDNFAYFTSYLVSSVIILIFAMFIVILSLTNLADSLKDIVNLQTYFLIIFHMYHLAISAIIFAVHVDFGLIAAGVVGMCLSFTIFCDALRGFVKYPPMPFHKY